MSCRPRKDGQSMAALTPFAESEAAKANQKSIIKCLINILKISG